MGPPVGGHPRDYSRSTGSGGEDFLGRYWIAQLRRPGALLADPA